MGSAILRIHLQSLFLLVHLIRMLTSWLVLRGSQFCTAEGNTVVCRGRGRLKLCGWHTGGCLCRQPTVQLWLCTERAEHMHSNNGTAKMAQQKWHVTGQLLCSQSGLALCRVCAAVGCAGHQPASVWAHGLCSAALGTRMVICGTGGVHSTGSWKHSWHTVSSCICLLINTQYQYLLICCQDCELRICPCQFCSTLDCAQKFRAD